MQSKAVACNQGASYGGKCIESSSLILSNFCCFLAEFGGGALGDPCHPWYEVGHKYDTMTIHIFGQPYLKQNQQDENKLKIFYKLAPEDHITLDKIA